MINYLSLFTGIGAFEKAMKNQGIPFNLVGFSDIDKYAVKSYCAMHGVSEELNLGDITKIDEKSLPQIDFITYGFPCQDISIAGGQKGLFNDDGTQTRSGLFFDALRIIEHTKPIVAIAENVKNLVGKKFNAQFQVILASLQYAGYNNCFAVLNAKDYGIPQNRERVFIVSIRNDVDTGFFEFPKPYTLTKCLHDVMEFGVDEKYYLDGKFETIMRVNEHYSLLCGGTIGKMHDISRRIYDVDYIAPSLHTCCGGNREPKIFEPMVIGGVGEKKSNGGTQWYQQNRIYNDNVAISVTTSFNPYYIDRSRGRPRKLTPKECFRLMGFTDDDFAKAEGVNSNTQLYKQAGNSIVVNVAEAIIKQIFRKGGEFDAVYR